MVEDMLSFDRLESTGTHMQDHICKINFFGSQLLHDPFGKMETGSRGGNRAVMGSINGLIAVYVLIISLPFDIGWQGHLACSFNDLSK